MAVGKILICVVLAVAILHWTAAKPAKKTKAKKVKRPRLNLKTLSLKMTALEGKLEAIETKVNRIDIANGRFRDDPPCPIEDSEGFHKSEVTQSCYRIEPSTHMMNWTEAQEHCSDIHGKSHLVAIETEDEQLYLKAKWYNENGISSVSRFWTDASKLGRDTWFWVTAAVPLESGYHNWIPTTSHSDDRFECVAVYANEGYAWGDVACWAPHIVTCEIEL